MMWVIERFWFFESHSLPSGERLWKPYNELNTVDNSFGEKCSYIPFASNSGSEYEPWRTSSSLMDMLAKLFHKMMLLLFVSIRKDVQVY